MTYHRVIYMPELWSGTQFTVGALLVCDDRMEFVRAVRQPCARCLGGKRALRLLKLILEDLDVIETVDEVEDISLHVRVEEPEALPESLPDFQGWLQDNILPKHTDDVATDEEHARLQDEIRKLREKLQAQVEWFVGPEYHCDICGVGGVRLWRPPNRAEPLYCQACAAEHEDVAPNFETDDLIGNLLPAVPDGAGNFWSYTMVPPQHMKRWRQLKQ